MQKSITTMAVTPLVPVVSIFVVLIRVQGVLMCDEDVCFTWTATDNDLILTCVVSDLLYRISIDDPSGITIAQCFPALTCLTPKSNALGFPNLSEFVVTVPINDNNGKTITGNWTCRHGSSGAIAETVVSLNGVTVETTLFEIQTTTVQHVMATTENSKTNSVEHKGHLFGSLFASLAALLVLLFVIFTLCLWIGWKCSYNNKKVWRLISKKQSSILSGTNRQPDFEYNNTGYECINEDNMIPNFPETHTQDVEVCMHHIPTLENHMQTSTSPSTKSGHSYLEVIADSNSTGSYEKANLRSDNVNSNIYCEFNHSDFFHTAQLQYLNSGENVDTEPRITSKLAKSKVHVSCLQISGDRANHETSPASKSCPELNLASQENVISTLNGHPGEYFARTTVRNIMSTVL